MFACWYLLLGRSYRVSSVKTPQICTDIEKVLLLCAPSHIPTFKMLVHGNSSYHQILLETRPLPRYASFAFSRP